MYCKYCGEVIADDAKFCSKCGRPQHSAQPSDQPYRPASVQQPPAWAGETGNGRQPGYPGGKKKKKHVWPIVLTVFLVLAVGICAAVWLLAGNDEAVDSAIATVQNGYLGQYTDVTVKQLLDYHYAPRYGESQWDGGYTDDDVLIVEARYFDGDDPENATTVQFAMLNGECFKVKAFVDPENMFTDSSEFYLALNYAYFLQHSDAHREALTEEEQMASWLMELDRIDSSEAQYGAGASYRGTRSELNQLDNSEKSEISVAMLLDAYDLVDLEPVDPVEEETQPPEEPEYTRPDTSGPEPDLSYLEPYYQELLLVLMGYHDLMLDHPDGLVNLYEIEHLAGGSSWPAMEPTAFMPVDLDGDGVDEVFVELLAGGEEKQHIILHYYDGVVYGYYFPLVESNVGRDGIITQRLDRISFLFSNIWFEGAEMKENSYLNTDADAFFIGWETAEWHDIAELF